MWGRRPEKVIENYDRIVFNNSPMLDSCLFIRKFKLENTDRGKLTPLTPFSCIVIRVNQQEKITQLSGNKSEERVQGRHDNP